MIYADVDAAVIVPVNVVALTDSTDFDTQETAVVYNQAGMALFWNFTTTAGVVTQTAVTPTTAGVYDWTNLGGAMYTMEIPASGGGSINNASEGVGYFSGKATGVLSWRGPDIVFRAAAINNTMIDGSTGPNTVVPPTEAQMNARTIVSADYFDPAVDAVANVTLTDTTTNLTNQTVAAGGTLFKALDGVTTTTVGTEAGTVANIAALDGVIHSYEDSGGTTTFYYTRTLAVNEVGSEFLWDGYVQSNGDTCTVQAYDWVQAQFTTIGTITGFNGTTILERTFPITADMTGTGADVGKVRIQFTSATATLVATDRCWVGFASVAAEAQIFASGVAQSGGNNTIQIASGDVIADDDYIRAKVLIIGGTGSTPKQEAIITSSVASTDTLTVTPAWQTNPDSTSVYEVIPAQAHSTVRNGGYDNEAVYFKTGGDTGTQKGVDGTSTNPVGDEADAYTIMAQENITRLVIEPGSTFTLPSDSSGKQFEGSGYTLILNGQELGDSTVTRAAIVTGVAVDTGVGLGPNFTECGIGSVTLPPCTGLTCGFFGTLTLGSEGNFTFGASSEVFDASLTVDYGSGRNASQFFLTAWAGGLVEIQNAGAGTGSYTFEMNGNGSLEVNANCSATTEVTLRGAINRNADVTGITYVELANSGTSGNAYTDLGGMSTGMKAEVNAEADTANTDYGANTVVPMTAATSQTEHDATQSAIAGQNDIAATDIVSAGAITTLSGAVVNVDTVDVTTTNTDMVGTDDAALASVATEARLAELDAANLPADVDTLITNVPDVISLAAINAEVDTAFTTQVADSVAADGSRPTREQALYMINQMLMEFAISGTTLTVKKPDGSTTLMSFTLDDATNPTSITRT
jgi:hypothetical protein